MPLSLSSTFSLEQTCLRSILLLQHQRDNRASARPCLVRRRNTLRQQRDQIRLFIETSWPHFFTKVALTLFDFFGLIWKTSLFKKKPVVVSFRTAFAKCWDTFYSSIRSHCSTAAVAAREEEEGNVVCVSLSRSLALFFVLCAARAYDTTCLP